MELSYILGRNFWVRKIKKIPLWKNFFYFLEKQLFLYFGNGTFLYFLKKKVSLIFRVMELYITKTKKFQKVTFWDRKINKKQLWKNFLYFGKWNFLALKNLVKPFYTLNKTPLGVTGCLSNLYYLLAAQASSFLIHSSFPNLVS